MYLKETVRGLITLIKEYPGQVRLLNRLSSRIKFNGDQTELFISLYIYISMQEIKVAGFHGTSLYETNDIYDTVVFVYSLSTFLNTTFAKKALIFHFF